MLESSVFLENSGGGASGGSASDAAATEFGGGGGEEGSRSSGGKRWPREETLALLKIRSEMDTAFRDSNLKAPLWDEVSRKLGELGYNRNAKKCKEKFENIYKYHKRTKDGRSIRHKGKNYKFFDQLELLDSQFSVPSTPLSQIPSYATETTQIATALLPKPITNLFQDFTMPSELMSDSTSTSSSSGKDSQGSSKKKKKKKKKKRKLEDYLEGLVKDILEKQEEMQNKFLEAVEKSQNDRMARTEAWLSQEMATIKRERQILAQERSTASAKDAYVLDFLKKITHQDLPITHISEILDPLFNNKPCDNNEQENNAIVNVNSIGEKNSSSVQTSSSRWPKAEVESLILLKTDLDMQYEENGPKGPLWEEISACMKKLGFERSAKRCKEKWENINKYYKRVKDGNKKRPQDSKTCPYFSMLESIYANKSKKSRNNDNNNNTDVSGGGCNLKPEQILMQMMGQVQQQNQEQLIRGEYDDGDSDRQEQEDDDDVSGCDGYQVVVANNNNMS